MSHLDHVDTDVFEFEQSVMSGKWENIINLYKSDKEYQTLKVNKNRGTALHIAISSGDLTGVKLLVSVILSMWDDEDPKHPLRLLNERGSTPLHIAAYRGFTRMCQCIIGENGERKGLIRINNDEGETPLFWAVQGNSKNTFVYLHSFFPDEENLVMDYKGTTILHVAIRSEMFDLANIIMHCYDRIHSKMNENGVTPFGELATMKSGFKSGNHLTWWETILYKCFPLKLQDAGTEFKSLHQSVMKDQLNAAQSGDISIQLNDVEEIEMEEEVESICDQFFKWPIVSLLNLEKIKIIKRKCLYADELLKALMVNFNESYWGGGDKPPNDEECDEEERKAVMRVGAAYFGSDVGNLLQILGGMGATIYEKLKEYKEKSDTPDIMEEHNETTYLVAAKHGIVEITSALEKQIISVIHDRNSNDENVLLLAVKYRQPQIVEELHNKPSSFMDKSLFTSLCQQVDKNGNTMLHLAAYTSLNKETTWTISGPAMQMMWEIKWYKYIKGIVPDQHFRHRINHENKTPGEVFKEEHKDLLQSSTEWLRDIAESCSVVAALIAGLSFATSGSVPGGNNDSGKPTLEGQPAFEGFAISSLIGLYSSGTAVIMFLAILTSQQQINNFDIILPVKLLAGLTTLFVSIVSMFISFCAGHFFVLTDKYGKNDILFYLLIVFSIPVIFYGIMLLPLYIELINIIRKKVPPPSIEGIHL